MNTREVRVWSMATGIVLWICASVQADTVIRYSSGPNPTSQPAPHYHGQGITTPADLSGGDELSTTEGKRK